MKKKEITSSIDHMDQERLIYYPRSVIEKDYINHSIDMGLITYTNIRDLLARFFLQAYYRDHKVYNWRGYCIGITSEICNNVDINHMPMFDYDGKNTKTLIRKDVKLLQKDFLLGPAHVFRTRRGFHVIFMCDEVPQYQYMNMLHVTKCCKGFQKISIRNKYGIIRISGKYTKFDIEPEYILEAKEKKLWRKKRKAHLIEALYMLGQTCGTHFASMFPDWARFQEDQKPWKIPVNKTNEKGKKIKKTVPKKIYCIKEANNKLQTDTIF